MKLQSGPSFFEVFVAEAAAINARRQSVADGRLARGRDDPEPTRPKAAQIPGGVTIIERGSIAGGGPLLNEREKRVPRPSPGHDLTGLALSGGGIRSASFCLGILQGLDAVREDGEPQLLDQIDYLSTVSGGGYIGTAYVNGLMETKGRFPFASKLDQEETIEVQHLRNYSNFLTPDGMVDVLVGVLAVFRGMLVNALIFLGIILIGAATTIFINPLRSELDKPAFLDGWTGHIFFWTGVAGALYVVGQPLVLVASDRLARPLKLTERERLSRWLAYGFLAWLAILFLEGQAYVLSGLFDAMGAMAGEKPADGTGGNLVATVVRAVVTAVSQGWAAVLPAAIGLIASVRKLLAVANATVSDPTRTGTAKRWISLVGLYLAAAVVPLALWAVYLAFSYWGIGWIRPPFPVHGHAPAWLRHLGDTVGFVPLYLLVALLIAGVSVFVRPNVGTLHGYYRDRLSRAFLWERERLRLAVIRGKAARPGPEDVDTLRFSSLKTRDKAGGWTGDVALAPYLLVNTAVNLEASTYLNRRGRNADNFVFSPLYFGSEATGYIEAEGLERFDPALNLGTAMAASGAAASANMGASTIKALTFTLSALNVRLGYWVPNPARVGEWGADLPPIAKVGPIYFALETFGRIDERTRNVYLTDGGHFDNLGLYELFKRRCRFIIAVDAEADPPMNFDSLVRLERYARIDLGVRIDLPLDFLRRRALAVTSGRPHGEFDDAVHCRGPHVAVGRIDYGADETGVLIYVKASLSGDENDVVRDYKRRNPEFPHETTIDQFFSEEQFEVYRSLGFHAAKRFFSGEDRFATLDGAEDPHWLEDLSAMLVHLNVADDAASSIVRRASRVDAGG